MRVEMSGFVVYTHSVNGVVFYVGMGSGARAFQPTQRNDKWRSIVEESGGFDVAIIAWHPDRASAMRLEESEIRSRKPEANLLMNGFKRSEAFKRALSQRKKGVKRSEETCRRMSEGLKGRVAPNKGKPLTPELREMLANFANKTARGVVDTTSGKSYPSIHAAARATGVPRSSLMVHLNGVATHAGGRTFAYAKHQPAPSSGGV